MKITVNMQAETVTVSRYSEKRGNVKETCTFYEAGINTDDLDEIKEHLLDRHSEQERKSEIEIEFEGSEKFKQCDFNRVNENVFFTVHHKSVYLEIRISHNDTDNPVFEYRHPLSGSYGTLSQAFANWSEQDDDINTEWSELQKFCDEKEPFDRLLEDLYWSSHHENSFNTQKYLE
jgi:hypothetical protein